MSEDKNRVSDNVAIERERQKTKRYLIFILAFFAIAIVGIVMVLNKTGDGGIGGVEVDLLKGKFSVKLEKPIVQQTKQPTSDYKTDKGDVQFTTGKIDSKIIQELENENVPISVNSFAGENYINTEIGFIFTVLTPEAWTVSYDPAGKFNPLVPVNILMTNDEIGSHLNITLEILQPGADLESTVMGQLQQMVEAGVIRELPAMSYDEVSETIFLSYFNEDTQGATYQKVILDESVMYVATANYNIQLTASDRIDDLIEMVASFTLISS